MYGSNNRPLSFAPPGGFPTQRISNYSNEIDPVAYVNSPVANLPTQEHEYSSHVNRARLHLAFGEAREGQRRVSIGEREASLKKAQIQLDEPGLSAMPRYNRRLNKFFMIPMMPSRYRRR